MIKISENKLTVLVTGVGAMGVGEGLVKCLNFIKEKFRIIATNMDHNAPLLYLADKGYIVPSASSKNYLKEILEICNKEKVNVLIPGSEAELKVISDNREIFEGENIVLLINTNKTINIGFNKWNTFNFLKNNGFCTPDSTLSITEKNFFKNNFPIVIKPIQGHGSQNIFIAKSYEEVKEFSQYLDNINCKHLFQKHVGTEKNEYTIGVLSDNNYKIIDSIVMRRYLKSGFSQYVEVIKNKNISKVCENIALKLGSIGPLNIQGRLIGDEFYVFEINPRFSGSAPFRCLAGFNEIDILINKIVLNKKINNLEIKELIGMRYLEEMIFEKDIINNKIINNEKKYKYINRVED